MKYLTKKLSVRALQLLIVACGCFASSALSADIPGDPIAKMDASGNQVAIWTLYPTAGGNSSIQVATYDAATTTWSSPTTVSAGGFDAWSPILVTSTSGSAVAGWTITDTVNGVYAIYTTIYDATAGTWSTPVRITPTTTQADSDFTLAINASNDIAITWNGYDTTTTNTNIWNNVGTVSSGFGTATVVY